MTSNKSVEKSTASAEGERRAMIGYLPQYELAAWAIMRHLRQQTLESVRMGDIKAGRVDDFVILSANAIDGHSVKWSEYRDTVTFRDLTKPRDKAPCWIAQLADGWKRLRENHPNRLVTVHLVTCDIPSKSDECPGSEKKSFAAFYHGAWIPFQEIGRSIPDEWKPAWEELRKASNLNAEDFKQFVPACHFDFHARIAADRTIISPDDAMLRNQLRALSAKLPDMVRDPSRQVEYSRAELLSRLGWTHLFEFRHRHEFPVLDPYEPIDSTVEKLESKLSDLEGGYLILLGSPGSGKSTLLTRTLEAGLHRYRLVKYYAFVPDSADPRTRGESENFLHHLVLSLEKAGFCAGESQITFDRSQLLDCLNQQLQKLGNDFAESGFATVILVDGLDHIPREQHPEQSLIEDLPHPDQIPAGVYFVLGSQTADLPGLSPSVRSSIQEPRRRILIAEMAKVTALKVVAATRLPIPLSSDLQERIVVLAGGLPLALALILNRLKNATEVEQIATAIEETVAFKGDLDHYYFAYWNQVESSQAVAELLGMIARLRRPIDVDWVSCWDPTPPLTELRRRFGHFFREEREGHLVFFHNSFRQYVLTKSGVLKGGTSDSANRAYHSQLAEICNSSEPPHSWEVVYHLAMARETARVLELAVPAYFREQLAAFRPLENLARDARFAATAAGELEDTTALVQISLFLAEIEQRAYSLDDWLVGENLLAMGHLDRALEYIWEGNELQISATNALKVARLLHIEGEVPLARKLFDAAEPLTIIQPANKGEQELDYNMSDLLQAWAEAVVLFRPVDEIIRLTKEFVPPKSPMGEVPAADEWRANLMYWAARSMERLGRMAEASALERCLREIEGERPALLIWLTINRFRSHSDAGRVAESRPIVEALLKSTDFPSFSDHAKLLVAQGASKLLGNSEAVAKILKSVPPPSISLSGVEGPKISEAMLVFRYFRLLMVHGETVSPNTVVPDPSKEDDWPRVLLERSLVQLAKVAADASRGKVYSSSDIRGELFQPLRLFERSLAELREWTAWYRVKHLRHEFNRLIVEVVHEHGPAALEGLCDELERLWVDQESAHSWPADVRRSIVIALYEAGISEQWVKAQLESVATTMLDGMDVSGRIDECDAQAKAWQSLGESEKALTELKRMVSVSFGVGYRKDSQLEDWVAWLDSVLSSDSTKAGERIALFAAAIAATENTTEGRGTHFAALSLIKACVPVSPRRAVALIHWFEKHRCINHANAVAILLQTASEKRLCPPSKIAAIYIHFLVIFSTSTHADLIGTILRQIADGTDRVTALDICRQIIDAAKSRALPTSRSIILRLVHETAAELGLPLGEFQLDAMPTGPHEESTSELGLKLKDGTTLDEEETAVRASTADGFVDLVNEAEGTYYRWNKLLESLLPKLTRAEVLGIAQKLPLEFEDSLALSSISRRLSDHGERDLAWQMAERAFNSSRPYGWAKYVDGGSRFEALRAFVAAKETPGRRRALQELSASLSSTSGSPIDIARRLIDIVPLVAPDQNLESIYPLVQDYVKLLSSPLLLLDDATTSLADTPSDDTLEAALLDLLAFHITDFVPLVAQGANRAMLVFLQSGSESAVRRIQAMLEGSEFQQVAAIGTLELLAVNSLEILRPYEGTLRRLAAARNWWIGETARRLCAELQLENVPPRVNVSLPSIYSLALPPTDDKAPSVGASEPLPDSDNPRDVVRPYDIQLVIMSEMANLDPQNLFYAAAREMKQIVDLADYRGQAESAYRSHLESAGIKLPYRRPRGAVAREAMRRIASDLIDGGAIHPSNVEMLHKLVRSTDPKLTLVDPSERPVAVKAMEGLGNYCSDAKVWTTSKTSSFANHLRDLDGRLVLAEMTHLKMLDWSAPTETRISVVGEKDLGTLDCTHPFKRVFDVQLDSYSTASPSGADPANQTIIRNQWWGADTDGIDWIALNPKIAANLDWSIATDGLFKWVNAGGETMVETIWWKDGCFELPPYEADCEVGEGLLVTASPAAAVELLQLLNEATRFLLANRSCTDDCKRLEAAPLQTSEPVVPFR